MARAKRAPRSGAPVGGVASSWTGERLALRANGLAPEQVVEIQRARIVGAMVEVVLELGAANVTVAHVVGRAGVSRRTYYDIFTDREDCFLAALDDAVERIAAVVVPAYQGEDPAREGARGARGGDGARQAQRARRPRRAWRERVRAALIELLGMFEADPGLGRFVVVESLAAGPRALALRNRALSRAIAAVDEGRAGSGPSPLTAEGVVGAVSSILYARLAVEEGGSLVELTGPLMGMIVLPYLGKAAAARELARPVPPVRASVQHGGVGYPFHELGMRLTYRTLRVLDAVAPNPDASNRQIADTAGIADQGQISKLLARLARLGLIDNAPGASAKGLSNKWRLTEKGRGIQRAIEEPRGATHDGTTSERGQVT
jgi:AcrR family transcriptional regulator/DNA-binding MarR family transcriptional regulator